MLAKIIDYQGMRNAIVVSNRSGFITKGHGRFEALQKLGWDQAPVDYQDYESEAQEYADIVADNKIAELANHDDNMMIEEIKELDITDFELLGMDDFELPIDPDEAKEAIEDDVPTDVDTRCKPGDLWILGEHRLLCGDSKDQVKIDELLGDSHIDLLLTDPPYGISVVKADGNVGGNRKEGRVGFTNAGKYGAKATCRVYKPVIGDDEPFDPTYLQTIGDNQIIWGANNFASGLIDNSHWIVWDKKMPADNDFSDAELAWTSFNKKIVKTYVFGWAGMIREGDRNDELVHRVHPTQKPVGLMANIIEDYNPRTVMDLFGGSGSTLIACEKTNRKCFMMEIDPHYCDVILSRWEKYSGNTAELCNN